LARETWSNASWRGEKSKINIKCGNYSKQEAQQRLMCGGFNVQALSRVGLRKAAKASSRDIAAFFEGMSG